MAHRRLKIIEESHISPPQGSVPSASLPLTFFDATWLTLPPVQSLFFYSYGDSSSTASFLHDTLPPLKHSLSLVLQHFYPFAGNLISPPPPVSPYLRYIDAHDSLLFIVAESPQEFDHLKADYPKDVRVLHDFVPKLPPASVSDDGVRTRPVMAMQLTVFPGKGICIGVTHNHVAGDGYSFGHSLKYWTSMCKSMTLDGDSSRVILPPVPTHAFRKVIRDPGRILHGQLEKFWSSKIHDSSVPPMDMVRATFSMNHGQIENLKRFVSQQCHNTSRVSSFTVTVAFTWVCWVRSQVDESETSNEDEIFTMFIDINCRTRLKYPEQQQPIPSTHFGNCMAPGIASLNKRELLGDNGILAASNAIADKIKEMVTSDLLKTAPTWEAEKERFSMSRLPLCITGSPKLRLYDNDFGLGKPCKVELVHTERGGTFSLSESRDGRDGFEIGIALNREKMDAFASVFENRLKFSDVSQSYEVDVSVPSVKLQ